MLSEFDPSRRRLLKTIAAGAAAIAINSACGADEKPPVVSAEPTPAPSVLAPTPTVLSESDIATKKLHQIKEDRKNEKRLEFIPGQISIPSIGINNLPIRPVFLSGGTFVAPEDGGLVTPNPLPNKGIISINDDSVVMAELLSNRYWIAGHSRWENSPKIFSSLQNINMGDEVMLNGYSFDLNPTYGLRFNIKDIVITDTAHGSSLTLNKDIGYMPIPPLAILQTSVRVDYARDWILNKNNLLKKARIDSQTDIDDPKLYLILLAFGEMNRLDFDSIRSS